ncbi:PREDICTED: protein SDA1 homolog [Priapulus caudatus]|uniref:Protein SDA1 n=1 Tax=Priapulus caudatus TaxID=37621 RepID=A0ABM1EVK1_PRICU|nr:PREDICTED: protein SDA1 homolog [Priapulus caudatus]
MLLHQVAQCYPEEMKDFPEELKSMLQRHNTTLHPEMRVVLCRALILLRNKGLVSPLSVLSLFFELLRCRDKPLRRMLYTHIVADIRNVNARARNNAVNTTLQAFMYSMLRDSSAAAAKTSLDAMAELYRRDVWRDARTVNVMATACFSKVTKVLVGALQFFLGRDDADGGAPATDSDDDSGTDDERKTESQMAVAFRVGKKTKKRTKRYERAKAAARKSKKAKRAPAFDFSALRLLHDPQGFAERLFRQLESSTERFEVRLMMLGLIAKLVGLHELILLNLYPYLQRFMQPHQRDVTKILLYAAWSAHMLVPPDVAAALVRTLVDNFVTERNSGEVMAVGLNAVREVCARCPLAMDADLLQDLACYKTHRNKSVLMGARSLIQLYREVDPTMLHRRDRGRPTEASAEARTAAYGELDTLDHVPGAEVITDVAGGRMEVAGGRTEVAKGRTEVAVGRGSNEVEAEEWEEEEMDDGDVDGSEDGWIDVHHSSDEEKEEESEELRGMSADERRRRAAAVSRDCILTQDDFEKIRRQQLSKRLEPLVKNRKHAQPATVTRERGEMAGLGDIERVHKRRRHDKDSRLATVLAGRADRETPGRIARPQKMNAHASTTNAQKRKTKPFMMIKQKMRGKGKRSFRDKQTSLRDSLLKRKRIK